MPGARHYREVTTAPRFFAGVTRTTETATARWACWSIWT